MNKKRLEIYKHDYDREMKYKSKINLRLKLPYAIVIVLFGILNYLINGIEEIPLGIAGIIYMFGTLMFIICLGFVVWYLILCYHDNGYKHMPTSNITEKYYKKIKNYNRDLKSYHSNINESIIDDLIDVENEFNEYLIDDYCKCNKKNRETNKIRWNYLYKANKFIVGCILSLSLCMTPIIFNKLLCNGKTVYMSIINEDSKKNLSKSKLNKEVIRMGDEKETEVTTSERPKRPSRPQPELIKESNDPKKEKNDD